MEKIILVFGIFSINLFFSISAILKYDYLGSSDSKIYIVYCISISFINIMIFFIDFFKKKFSLNKNEILLLCIPYIYIIIYIFTIFFYGNPSRFIFNYFNYFILWGVPSICIGIYINKMNLYKELIKYIDIIIIIYSLGIINSVIIPFLNGVNFQNIGGATYQSASYISAFVFGLNLYFIFFGSRYKRFNFTKNRVYKILEILFLFIQVISSLISGGRGGIVLIIVYIICILFFVVIDGNKKIYLKFFLLFGIIIIISIAIMPELINNEIFQNGLKRAFEFISSSGKINWKGTSGRDVIYENAIDTIKNNPIIGIGLFKIPKNPHNFLLEILLGGGFVYLSLVFIIAICFSRKLFNMIKYNTKNRVIIIIGLYPLIMLMFSGTYMNSQEFWFILSFVFSYKLNNKHAIYK